MNGTTTEQGKLCLYHQMATTTQKGLAWFDHLEESFSYKEVQFKKFCPLVETSHPVAENINENSTI